MSDAPEKPKKYEDHLMTAFAFDEDDLAANQAGQISRRQIDHLRLERKSASSNGALLALVGLLGLAIVLPAISASSQSLAGLPFPFAVGALVIGLGFVSMTRASRLTADARAQRVSEVEGRVDLAVRVGRNSATYSMLVDKLRFPLKQPAFLAFKNGDPYRIYYAPRSKRILSVEWLREDDNLLDTAAASDESVNDEIAADESSAVKQKRGS